MMRYIVTRVVKDTNVPVELWKRQRRYRRAGWIVLDTKYQQPIRLRSTRIEAQTEATRLNREKTDANVPAVS